MAKRNVIDLRTETASALSQRRTYRECLLLPLSQHRAYAPQAYGRRQRHRHRHDHHRAWPDARITKKPDGWPTSRGELMATAAPIGAS